MITKHRTNIRKKIARLERMAREEKSFDILDSVNEHKTLLKDLNNVSNTPEDLPLPTLGKLRLVLEKEVNEEHDKLDNDYNKSDLDYKRLALKEAVLEYYNDLNVDLDTVVVDYDTDMTLRRDDKEIEKTDFDFAPNKNNIYARWMEKLRKLVQQNKINPAEYDESIERGIPQGGAFEKQLDRYRKDFMRRLWKEHYEAYRQ